MNSSSTPVLLMKSIAAFFCLLLVWTPSTYAITDEISFTQPLYRCVARERDLLAVVQSDVMMGMWLNNVTRDVRYSVVGNSRKFQATSRTFGNFIFLELRVTSLTQSTDVQVQATVSALGQTTFCTVHVEVIDVNDFQPLFPFLPYEVSVPENTKVGSVVATVKATDSDRDYENTRFYYNLPESTSDYFAVHPTTGVVTLTALLNAEAQSVHSVVIQATDRKAAISGTAQPKTTTLVVTVQTVNLHDPILVLRDLAAFDVDDGDNRLYGIVKVSDSDPGEQGEINPPLITRCSIPDLLVIEPHSKENEFKVVFARSPTDVTGTINATIEVSDRGNPPRSSRLDVSINVSDKRKQIPIFKKSLFNFTVSEISPVHTQVGLVQAEIPLQQSQFGDIQYSILSGNDREYFSINTNTSLISTRKRLNFSKTKFVLVVAASNTKTTVPATNKANVVIVVQDANDHDPIFTEQRYSASFPENAPVGSHVVNVVARDEDKGANGSIIYDLVDSQGLPVQVDPFNGTIFTTAALSFDVPSKNSFDLLIRARDSGFPFSRKSECLVAVSIVNTNDNVPEFAEIDCVVSVAIFTPAQTEIVRLEPIDIDQNPVTCSLLSGPEDLFEVDSRTCVVRLATSLNSRRVGERLELQVVASDTLHTSSPAKVTISIIESGKIERKCRDTGAIRRFEEAVGNRRFESYGSNVALNRTSRLPNKHKPVVIPRSVTVSIPEDTQVDSQVHRIEAHDADKGYNGKLWYTIISGNEDACFAIDTQSGVVSVATPLDRERKSLYDLVVKVSDLGTISKFALVRVRFLLIDVNDNSPEFGEVVYSIEIPENVSVGHSLNVGITATDRDEGNNSRLRYDIVPSPHSDDFTIDSNSAKIRVSKRLDRERVPMYNLTVRATDSSSTEPRTATATLMVRLSDVNDNAPKFHQSQHRIQIAEDLPINTVVFWLQARDPDAGENGEVRYTLTDGVLNRDNRHGPRFRVDDRTGVIRLSRQLDARVQSRYNITARARDLKKLYSTCYIVVEVVAVNKNLHAPYFAFPYTKLEVSESAPIGTNLGAITALDDDRTEPERSILYRVGDGSGIGVFSIDPKSGFISNARSLDYESEQFYWLTVIAEDQASVPLSGHVFVLVQINDVNDNVPEAELPSFTFSVPENSPPKTYVGQVRAKDRDSGLGGVVTYDMKESSYFGIDSVTGVIRTSGKRYALDRESVSADKLSLDVVVSDSGSPSLFSIVRVWIKLTDVNDNSPEFSQFLKKRILLPERNKTQTPEELTSIIAWDSDAERNGDVVYTLNASKSFVINPATGAISSTGAFSEDQRSVLRVTCTDKGENKLSSKFRLEIEWVRYTAPSIHSPMFVDDDWEPTLYFEHVDFSYISEESLFGRNIRLLQATDLDSDLLWFRIIDGNADRMFDISHDHVLYVAGNPDAEIRDRYNITIEVTDGHNRASKNMTIEIVDVNDHRPAFESTSFTTSFPENSPPDSHVITLQATDGDVSEKNRNFIYSIRSSVDPTSASKFRITSTGEIYSTVALDRESQHEHVLIVEVDDQGVPATLQSYCRLRILVTDVNEHAPTFSSSTYYGKVIQEDSDSSLAPVNADEFVVVRVQATDLDYGRNAMISYFILEGNEENLWKIDSASGEISLARNFQDNKDDRISIFNVTARDGARESRSTTTLIRIEVARKSNNPPRFIADEVNLTVLENVMPGSFVTKLSALTEESSTYDITSGNEDGKFSINPHSGLITLDDRLDREHTASYRFNVSCTSASGEEAEASVIVRVSDVNDNRPWFPVSTYTGFFDRAVSMATTSFVLSNKNKPLEIQAFDPDDGKNGKLIYRIADGNTEIQQMFAVDSFSGMISLKSGRNTRSVGNEYQFEVEAFDLGNPQLSSTNRAIVNVHVIDDNHLHIPSFKHRSYNFTLYSPVVTGMLVNEDPGLIPKRREKSGPVQLIFSLYGSNSHSDSHSAFRIDPQSGKLFVRNSKLVIAGNKFDLNVRITDGKTISISKIFINVYNPPRSSFAFSQDVYETDVTENSLQVQPLVSIYVDDTALNDHFHFTILNPHPGFEVGFTSGVISTTGVPLDREVKSSYELLIEAADVSTSSNDVMKRSRCIVRLTVTDVNDNSPEFESLVYRAVVQRSKMPGAVVKQVRAVDLDSGVNGRLFYSFEDRRNDLFEINSSNGVITLRRSPSLIEDDVNVTILVHDAGASSLTSRTTLQVVFVNQSSPIFTKSFYDDIAIAEDAHPYTIVTDDVKASSSEDSSLFYTIEDGDPYRQFEIDAREGTLKTLGKLDCEHRSLYRLRVRVRTSHSKRFTDTEVEVKVIDVNDNSPVFVKPSYSGELQENNPPGHIIMQVEAVDADVGRNGHVSYEIVNRADFDGDYFHIDSTTGVVWAARSFDFEEKQEFSFLIRATDDGVPMRHADVMAVVEVVDVNDNAPTFDQNEYEFVINEDAQRGSVIGKVTAFDLDRCDRQKIIYFLQGFEARKLLTIDPVTGVLAVKDAFSSIPTRFSMKFNITATDGIFFSFATVTLHSNGSSNTGTLFRFDDSIYNFTVVENLSAETTVGTVAVLDTTSVATYSIISSTMASDYFHIHPTSGRITTTQAIDRESILQLAGNAETIISLLVSASNEEGVIALAKILVEILDENDNPPIFDVKRYKGVLKPDMAVGEILLNVTARDFDASSNGRVSYSWGGQSRFARTLLHLNQSSGVLKLAKKFKNCETFESMQFFINAVDQGENRQSNSVSVSVICASSTISVPKFNQSLYFATAPEDKSLGFEVLTVKASSNAGAVTYSLAEPYTSDDSETNDFSRFIPFVINRNTGAITLSGTLDREKKSVYHVTALAHVSDSPELVTTTELEVEVTDVNDNAPQFDADEYRVTILENAEVGTDLVTLRAVDMDQDNQVTYGFQDPSPRPHNIFTINNGTGRITLRGSLDREEQSHYDLVVYAIDGNNVNGVRRRSACHVIVDVIDVNDSPPRFLQQDYVATISESALTGYVTSWFIGVEDDDERGADNLAVYIVAGDPAGQFALRRKNQLNKSNVARLSLEVVKGLDREQTSFFLLTLLVTDGRFNGTTSVRVNVDDVNDNKPVCSQLSYHGSVFENSPSGVFLLRILSSDADAGKNGRVRFSLSGKNSHLFDLDSRSGRLFTAASLDREVTSQHVLVATASDSIGQSCSCQVLITVKDVNDNSPLFVPSSLHVTVYENEPIKSLVHQLLGHDLDLGESGSFYFSLGNESDDQFYVEPETGLVSLQRPLDREKVSSYEIRVKITDRGFGGLSTRATLRVQVLDVNDNPPVFDKPQYVVAVKENLVVGGQVARVSARSLDTGLNAQLLYSITRGNEHKKFSINQDTGEVGLVEPLDFESDRNYVIKISARDSSDDPLSSDCTLRVNVLDVNDNAPEFTSDFYQVELEEDASPGQVFFTALAIDRDENDAQNLTYRLLPANLPFHLNPISGEISVVAPGLNFENKKSYRIKVQASDNGHPVQTSRTTVEVLVLDVNDNRPQFLVSTPLGGISETLSCSQSVANCTVFADEKSKFSVTHGLVLLNATDADGETNSRPFRFRIKSGNDKGLFYIDHDNILKSRRRLKLASSQLTDGKQSRNQDRLVHRLVIEVGDTGVPRLTSRPNLQLDIVLLKKGKHAPSLTPHSVEVVTVSDTKDFIQERLTLRLDATDEDVFDRDRLRFSLALSEESDRFSIDSLTGAITTNSQLHPGEHEVLVRVSDGSRSSTTSLPISVSMVDQHILERSVSISFLRFPSASAEAYLQFYHAPFLRKLKSILPNSFDKKRDFVFISLHSDAVSVQLLFAVRKSSPGFEKASHFYSSIELKRILVRNQESIQESLRLQINSIEGTSCDPDFCFRGRCEQIPFPRAARDGPLLPVTTDAFSLVTPHFKRKKVCKCPSGTIGPDCTPICSPQNNPCAKGFKCIRDSSLQIGYRCDSPDAPVTSMTFTGQSLARFSIRSATRNLPLNINLRMRTFKSNCTIFYASGARYLSELRMSDGHLVYSFKCGGPLRTMTQNQKLLNDGQWHNVSIRGTTDDATSCGYKLTLDDHHTATIKSPGHSSLPDFTKLVFGGFPKSAKSKRSLVKRDLSTKVKVRDAFVGCIQNATLNRKRISLEPSSGVSLEYSAGVTTRCRNTLIDMGACPRNRCANGGKCLRLSDGLYECTCPATYDGDRCETLNSCGPVTCSNSGNCTWDGEVVKCHCNQSFFGERCEFAVACHAIDQCRNGGSCTVDQSGQPLCSCAPGWTGPRCEIDVDECKTTATARNHCGGLKNCFNFDGGFACNCTAPKAEHREKACRHVLGLGSKNSSADVAQPSLLILILAAVFGGTTFLFVIVLVVVCWRRKKKKNEQKYLSGSRPSRDLTPIGQFSPPRSAQQSVPPQVPQRPVEYPLSSRNQLQSASSGIEGQGHRSPLIGLVHPQILNSPYPIPSPSESGSVLKPPYTLQDYERLRTNGSAASSFQLLPTSRRSSSDTQSQQHWNMMEGTHQEVFLSPSPSRSFHAAPYGRGGLPPSTPDSHRSISSSSSAYRSHQSQRSDALTGHYNVGKRRRQKQLLQMIAMKERNEKENMQIQRVLSHLVSQELADEDMYVATDSCNSSLRSSLSQYQPDYRDIQTAPNSKPTFSRPTNHPSTSSSDAMNSSQNQQPFRSQDQRDSPYMIGHPVLTSEFELQTLQEEEEDAVISASLLPISYKPPSTAKTRFNFRAPSDATFQPIRKPENDSFSSINPGNIKNHRLESHPTISVHDRHLVNPPFPSGVIDGEHLSLSEGEEDEMLRRYPESRKSPPVRSPSERRFRKKNFEKRIRTHQE